MSATRKGSPRAPDTARATSVTSRSRKGVYASSARMVATTSAVLSSMSAPSVTMSSRSSASTVTTSAPETMLHVMTPSMRDSRVRVTTIAIVAVMTAVATTLSISPST
ncbi:hypothetical protein [Homoserinibacter gongjuensis]|uniref:hypothetical protein n=1 Tax=Homoserinibacter gongjuensis TaxID=1162968 RepID=UPI0024E09D30|nr:hypothetical protein [Homoserinibacter gongjuensis]